MLLSLIRALSRSTLAAWLSRPVEWVQRQGREDTMLRWTVKVLGWELVHRHYAAGLAGFAATLPEEPLHAGLTSRTCRQADIESNWLRHWCRALDVAPFYHRKLWEYGFICQVLWEAGMLQPGRRALGFAVGQEPLPAILASRGVSVLATDIAAGDQRAQDWIRTGQHSTGLDALHRAYLQDRESFERLVRFRHVDMGALPPDLQDGSQDIVWSACAMEHLGTLERGLDFVLAAMRCLKPGGIAVHTTEMNLNPEGRTLRRGPTVLYQRRHLEALAGRLAAEGHRMLPLDDQHVPGIMDQFVDIPPFGDGHVPLGHAGPPHLRLSVGGFPATSAGIVVIAGGSGGA